MSEPRRRRRPQMQQILPEEPEQVMEPAEKAEPQAAADAPVRQRRRARQEMQAAPDMQIEQDVRAGQTPQAEPAAQDEPKKPEEKALQAEPKKPAKTQTRAALKNPAAPDTQLEPKKPKKAKIWVKPQASAKQEKRIKLKKPARSNAQIKLKARENLEKMAVLKEAAALKAQEKLKELAKLKEKVEHTLQERQAQQSQLKQDAQNESKDTYLLSANQVGAAERRKQQEAVRRKAQHERLMFALMLLFGAVALISLTMIVKIVSRSIRTHMTNKQLAERREQLAEKRDEAPELQVFAPEETAESEETAWAEDMAEAEGMAGAQETPDVSEQMQAALQPTPTPKGDVVKTTRYHVASGTALSHMEELYEENRDLIGWLRMEEILDLPVMYKDNSYYLKRDFYKNKNEAGTLFLDVNHRFSEKTQNLLLHGHNMKDGTMFGRLTQYLSGISYLKNNPFVQFDTLWREEHYVIFAVLRVSLDVKSDRFFDYFSHPTFASDAQFESYIRRLQLRSEYAIPIEVSPGDALLTLSTCLEDDRLVIVCRRLRPGETRAQLRSQVHLAVKQ